MSWLGRGTHKIRRIRAEFQLDEVLLARIKSRIPADRLDAWVEWALWDYIGEGARPGRISDRSTLVRGLHGIVKVCRVMLKELGAEPEDKIDQRSQPQSPRSDGIIGETLRRRRAKKDADVPRETS